MAVINFIRNNDADLSSVRLLDGQIVLDIGDGEVKMFHDCNIDGNLQRLPLSSGSKVDVSGENLVFK